MMINRKNISRFLAVLIPVALIAYCLVPAGDTVNTTDVTFGDVNVTSESISGEGNTLNVESTNTFNEFNEITEKGYEIRPNVYLPGYGHPYAQGPAMPGKVEARIRENTKLLISIDKKIDLISVRLARIEKALNIEPIRPIDPKPGSPRQNGETLRYKVD